MGFFSWLTADTKEPVANVHSEHPNGKRSPYIIQPNGKPPIGGTPYEGYGEIGGVDAYEWLAHINGLGNDRNVGISIEHGDYYEDKKTGELWHYGLPETFQQQLGKPANRIGGERGNYGTPMPELGGKSANDMIKDGQWVRHGVSDMAKHQLKISYNPNAVYEQLPPSEDDPNQGYFYSDEEIENAERYSSEEVYTTIDDPDNPGQQLKVHRGFEDIVNDSEDTNESLNSVLRLAGLSEMNSANKVVSIQESADISTMTFNEIKDIVKYGTDLLGNKMSGVDVMEARKCLQQILTERPWKQ